MKLAVAHVCNLIGVSGSTRNAKPTANYIPHACSVCNVIGAHHSTRNAPQGCNLIGRYIYITFQSSLFTLKQIRVCLRPAYIFAGLGCRAWCSSLVTFFCLFVSSMRGGGNVAPAVTAAGQPIAPSTMIPSQAANAAAMAAMQATANPLPTPSSTSTVGSQGQISRVITVVKAETFTKLMQQPAMSDFQAEFSKNVLAPLLDVLEASIGTPAEESAARVLGANGFTHGEAAFLEIIETTEWRTLPKYKAALQFVDTLRRWSCVYIHINACMPSPGTHSPHTCLCIVSAHPSACLPLLGSLTLLRLRYLTLHDIQHIFPWISILAYLSLRDILQCFSHPPGSSTLSGSCFPFLTASVVYACFAALPSGGYQPTVPDDCWLQFTSIRPTASHADVMNGIIMRLRSKQLTRSMLEHPKM
jgi:hypothetical protein